MVISAISTAHGTGGVAIVRLSGDGALEIAEKMFFPLCATAVKNFKPNMMYVGNIDGGGFYDLGMCVYFKAPKSFTGEDVVEFHCHGGVELTRSIFRQTLKFGARSADEGEFTKRAFINGKLSLSSAEGMIDMINAESSASLRAGSMLYGEKLTREIKSVQSELTDVLAKIAVDIDYPDEADETSALNIETDIKNISDKLKKLSSQYSSGKKIKDGVTVAIFGKPNTGKSSLLNALLGYDKAIVSSEAGTTRDAVEGEIIIDGVKFNLIDTAGIRSRAGEVEAIGIERAKKIISSADIILSVSDGGGEAEIPPYSGKLIRVFNKTDITEPRGNYDIAVSAKSHSNLEKLKTVLSEKSLGGTALGEVLVIEERHYSALIRAENSLNSAMENADNCTLDLLSIDLKDAWDSLGEITGETANEEIISTVFAKFCVGK